MAEGCYNCHSQQIRPLFAETERYGEYSKPGEFIYDRPFQWGSRRIGPDLAREGGRQSPLWHFEHFREPAAMTKGSVMPAYPHLSTTKLNFKSIQARVDAAALLGAPYDRELEEAEAMAREQAAQIVKEIVDQGGVASIKNAAGETINLEETHVIAMIAYLQRLGTDLFATPETTETVEVIEETVASTASETSGTSGTPVAALASTEQSDSETQPHGMKEGTND